MSFETITFGRITNSYLNQSIINNTMSNQKKYVDLNMEYSSQKKVMTLSDDPMSITTLLGAKNDLSKIADYTKNIDLNSAELKFTDDSFASLTTDVTRVNELATSASNELNTTKETSIMADEIQEILKHVISIANTNYAGKNVFSGASVNSAAYSVVGNNYKYQGTTDADGYKVQVQASDNISITLNENGNNIFGEHYVSTSTVSYGLIGDINQLMTALRSNPPDFTTIRSKLDSLKDDAATVSYYRAKVGTNMNTLDKIKTQLGDQKISSESIRGSLEDANVVEVASKLQYQEFALQASLQSATKVVQNSLLNFLSGS